MGDTKKYLHIINPCERLPESIVKLISKNFNYDKHRFLIIKQTPFEGFEKWLGFDNVEFLQGDSNIQRIKSLYITLKDADYIIWHGLYIGTAGPIFSKGLLLFLNVFSGFLSKSAWVAWDADLFGWESRTQSVGRLSSLKARCVNYLGKRAREKIMNYISIFPPFTYVFRERFNSNSKILDASYTIPDFDEILEKARPIEKCKKYINILVAHSGSIANNPFTILDSLTKFRYKNIRIYILLSSMDRSYALKVKRYAYKLYGEKAICIFNELSTEKYARFLWAMDIAMFNINKQEVIQTIHQLLFLGKKVYLPNNTVMYDFFTSQEIKIFDINSISDMKFNEFIEPVDNLNPSRYILSEMNTNIVINKWKKIFEEISSNQQKVKYLHVIRPSVILAHPVIKLIDSYFDHSEHQFLIINPTSLKGCVKFLEFDNVDFLQGKTRFQKAKNLYTRLKNAEHIIWHGLYVGFAGPHFNKKQLLFLNIFSGFLEKTAWLAWGLDLYEWEIKSKKLKARLVNYLGKRVREKMAYFITIFPPDGDAFRRRFNSNAPIFDGSYAATDYIEILEKTRPIESKNKKCINIMVAHSANAWNNHIDILDSLTEFRDKDIRLYILLSTGLDRDYSRKVEEYAKNLFGAKAICIYKLLPIEKYVRFLWSMDIAIFRVDRQAALGNIQRLLYMGKKVFLPKNTIMYDFFRSQGIEIFDSEDICNISFDDFIQPVREKKPPEYVLNRMNLHKAVEKWQHIFDKMDANKLEG